MSLLQVTNKNKYGNLRTRIMYNPTSNLKINPNKFGGFLAVKLFKYEHTHPVLPPTLFTNQKGQKFLMPDWIPVLPETELSDVIWKKPKKKVEKSEQQSWTFKSSSSDKVYKVTKNGEDLKCNCFGFWRARDRKKGCKHIQEVNKNI